MRKGEDRSLDDRKVLSTTYSPVLFLRSFSIGMATLMVLLRQTCGMLCTVSTHDAFERTAEGKKEITCSLPNNCRLCNALPWVRGVRCVGWRRNLNNVNGDVYE